MSYEFRLQLDGTLICSNCKSTIMVFTDEVFKLHDAKCQEWAKLPENYKPTNTRTIARF